MTNDIAIVVPVFNEKKVIKDFLHSLKKERPKDTIIIVNDCSTDNSGEILEQIDGIYLLTHEINMGQGAALQTGIEFARKLGLRYAVTIDSDGQHNPKDIKLFEETMKKGKYDIVLGSRFLGNAQNISFIKKIVLKMAIIFTWIISGIKLTDTHNGFRMIKISNKKFNITQNRMAHASEVIDVIKNNNLKYKEIPCAILYNEYTKQKGQKLLNSLNIILEILFKRLRV